MFGGNFAPVGWAFCDGSVLSIAQYELLFNIIGTTYGGNGTSTFALPDLRGRAPVHQTTGFVLGQNGGAEAVTLTAAQLPVHSHAFMASTSAGNQPSPFGFVPAANNTVKLYAAGTPNVSLAPQAILANVGNQPHSNIQPYLCINFILALEGIYPSPN